MRLQIHPLKSKRKQRWMMQGVFSFFSSYLSFLVFQSYGVEFALFVIVGMVSLYCGWHFNTHVIEEEDDYIHHKLFSV